MIHTLYENPNDFIKASRVHPPKVPRRIIALQLNSFRKDVYIRRENGFYSFDNITDASLQRVSTLIADLSRDHGWNTYPTGTGWVALPPQGGAK